MKSVDSLNSLITTTLHLQLQIHEAQHPACPRALPVNPLHALPRSRAGCPRAMPRTSLGCTSGWQWDTRGSSKSGAGPLECPQLPGRPPLQQHACRESLRYFYVLTNFHSFGSGRETASSPHIRKLSLFISSFKLPAHKRRATKSTEVCLSCAPERGTNACAAPARHRQTRRQDGASPGPGSGGAAEHPPPAPLPGTPTGS